MSVILAKGQGVCLKKHDDTLKKVDVILSWQGAEPETTKKRSEPNIDCDASAFLCCGGKVTSEEDIVAFFNEEHESGSVILHGDNTVGGTELLTVEFDKVPYNFDKIVIGINIYDAASKGQHFGMIKNASVSVRDSDTKVELCSFNLTEDYNNVIALICAELRRSQDSWECFAIGKPINAKSIREMARAYK